MGNNNEFQKTPCTDECYVRISDLKQAILENPYDPAKGEISGYLRYLKYNTPFRTDAWIPCSERLPKKYGWYQVILKDGRVSRLYYDYKGDRWIDNVRKHMFELYDIYSKITHKRITEEKEDVYWDDWVVAWMPMPEPYKEGGEDGRS